MKRLMVTIVYVMCTSIIASAQFAGGEGSETDPYQIATLEQLQAMGQTDHLDKHFVLINDIDAGETATWNKGKGFDPIGRLVINEVNEPFTGTFDGSGFTISNLTINRPDESYVGLFGYVYIATIINIMLDHVQIEGDRVVGGLVGGTKENAELLEIQVINATISGDRQIGGVAGNFSGTLSGSVFSGVLNGRAIIGGLAGIYGGIIEQSYADIEISGGSEVGGLVGYNDIGTIIKQSFAKGDISGSSTIGGLAGWNWGGEISDSYAMVNVAGESAVGGLIGVNESAHIGIEHTEYARITDSYAAGEISGNTAVGGVIGYDISDIIKSTYWDTEISGQSEAAGNREVSGARGLTTTHMTGQDAYIHMYKLDFDQVWQLTEGYPVLEWQQPDDAVDQPEVPIITVFPDAEEYDYGEVETDSSSSVEFTIENTGNTAMNGEVGLAGADNDGFEIVQGEGEFTLEPGSSRIVEVVFRPTEPGSYQAVLEFHHNAPNEGDPIEIFLKGTGKVSSSLPSESELPRQPALHPNYPNPFNPVTVIAFELPESSEVILQIFDITGRLVETLVDQAMPAGVHQATWDASNAASGVYIYRISAGDFVQSRSMMLIK